MHATYLITGVRSEEEENHIKNQQASKPNGVRHSQGDDGEDSLMQDNSFMSSSLPEPSQEEANTEEKVPVMSITLVQEEDLDGMSTIDNANLAEGMVAEAHQLSRRCTRRSLRSMCTVLSLVICRYDRPAC